MANTFAATLAALGPDHHWPLDEASGDYIDDGDTAGFDLAVNGPGGDIANAWRQSPGLCVRGTPRSYGILKGGASAPYGTFAGGVATVGHNTGVWGLWFIVLDPAISSQSVLFSTTFGDSSNTTLRLYMTTTYGARLEMTGVSSRRKRISAASAITANTPHLFCVVQRADGNDAQIYIDGVKLSTNIINAGGIGPDDWIAQIMVGLSTSRTTVGGLNVGNPNSVIDGAQNVLVSEPFIFVNSVISDADIVALYDSANLGSDADDYYEHVWDIGRKNLVTDMVYHGPGFISPAQNDGIGFGVGLQAAGTETPDSSGFDADDENILDNVPGRRIVSAYSILKCNYDPGDNSTFSGSLNWAGTETVGTWNVIVTARGVGTGDEKVICTMGLSNTRSVEIGIVGSAIGYQLFFRGKTTAGGDVYHVLSGIIHLGIDDQFWMFSIVQPGDGSGVVLYVNGDEMTGIPDISTDPDIWIDQYGASSTIRWGGQQGSAGTRNWEPGDLHKMVHLRYAMTALEISVLWDAVLGIFGPVPFGAFAALLDNTGNGGLSEGPGPDWWWRMNATSAPVLDIGIAQDRSVSPINADSIAEGGGPLYRVSGPLPDDAGNFSVFFDGVGDYLEIGVNAVAGELVDVSTGSMGCFFSRNALVDENIIYAQSNDAGTAYWRWGLNGTAVELIVQTSVGNRVTLTSAVLFSTNAFRFVVLTCDGSVYRLYIDGVEDVGASVVAIGTGAEGDWFDAFAADNSSIASEADVGFTTETTGRVSELFIYDGEVLSSAVIAALYEAAIADGILGTPATAGLLVFENVTFKNGALSDIRASNAQPSTFQQVVRGNRCKFLGGQQGDGITEPQCVLLEGPVHATFRGCEADLQAVPVFGRGGIVGTALNTALVATQDGSLIVSDCDFDQMGLLDGSTFLAPVMILAAFGMTVEDSRFNRCLGTAVGWRADAQRVSVINNQIKGTTQALGAIYSAQGLNARLGNAWLLRGNKAIDTVGPAINLNGVSSAGGTSFARNIAIQRNELDNNLTGPAIRVNGVGDILIEKNKGDRCTFGVELVEIAGRIALLGNEIDNASMTAYFAGEATLQLADVTMDRNKADGASVGDGLLITQVRRAYITNNELSNMDNGVGIGEITVEGTFDGNNIVVATTPFQFLAATTRVAFDIGINRIASLGNANQITVSTDTIEVNAHYHTVTAGGAINLDTIDGPLVDGFTLILRRGLFSSDITLRDGIDNLNIGSDFLMDVDNDQIWLVRNGANWNQLQRVEAL